MRRKNAQNLEIAVEMKESVLRHGTGDQDQDRQEGVANSQLAQFGAQLTSQHILQGLGLSNLGSQSRSQSL